MCYASKILRTYFPRARASPAVDNVPFSINEAETSVSLANRVPQIGRVSFLVALDPPPRVASKLAGRNSLEWICCIATERQLQAVRGDSVAMISGSDDVAQSVLRVGDQVMSRSSSQNISRAHAWRRGPTVARGGIQDAEKECARIRMNFRWHAPARMMSAALIKTKLLIADEPTTALDVTVQAQMLELIRKMQRELGTLSFHHDMIRDRRWLLRSVRSCTQDELSKASYPRGIFYQPKHPYNQACKRDSGSA